MFRFVVTIIAVMLGAGAAQGEDVQHLNILVYGATGKVGSLTVDEALNRGHRVTAVSRDPSRIQTQHENLKAAKGDLLDSDSIASLVSGQ